MFVLHIAERASAVTEMDPSILAVAAIGLVGVLAAIWLPALLRGRVLQRRAIGSSLAVLTLLALLPTAAPIDHVLGQPAQADAAVHREHCHGAPASCSDAPFSAEVNQFLSAEPLAVAPAMLLVLLLLTTPVLTGITRRPDLRPPLTALRALP